MFVRNLLTIAVIFMFVVLVVVIQNLRFPYPEKYQIEDFQLLEQPDDITCGPTSAAMVLHIYGIEASIEEVKNETKTEWLEYNDEKIGMTSPEYIAIALSNLGVKADLDRGYIERLKHYVSQGRPCIVLLRSGEYTWHYVVVIGFTAEHVIVADPGSDEKLRPILNSHFEGAWSFETNIRGESLEIDWINTVLRAVEVYPYMMIVPKEPC